MKSVKRTLALLLSALMLIGMIPFGALAAGQEETGADPAIVSIEETSGMPGSTVEVPVEIENNPGITSMGLSLTFDENLTLIGAENGSAFSKLTMTPPSALLNGGEVTESCRFAWFAANIRPQDVADGVIVTLTFRVSETAPLNQKCRISLSCQKGDVLDNARNSVDTVTLGASVKVIDYIPGDVDGSGNITMLDVLMLCQYYVDGCKYDPKGYAVLLKEEAGDVDASGTLTMRDVLMICQYYVDGCKYDPAGYAVRLLPGRLACDHTLQPVAAQDATCEEDGHIAYWYCITCSCYYKDADAAEEITYEETVIAAKGHTVVVDPAVPATYESTGLTEGSHCSVCNAVLKEQRITEKLKPNTKSIIYNIVNEAEHPYLATLSIDTGDLKYSYIPGQTLTLANLDLGKFGYTFDGWYDGFGKNATQIKEIPDTATEDITLYAHVTETVYDITYNLYQTPVTSSPSEEQLHYSVSKGNSNLYNPVINNYLFLGWYDNNGVEYKSIPVGTTGHITLNAYYTSLRNLAVSKTDTNPLILEDQNTNVAYFTYEIGEIRNIPLLSPAEKPFWEVQSVAGLSQQVSKTVTSTISNTAADSVSKSISDMTVNSSTWTLSESWNDVTTVDETWAESLGKTAEQCKTEATTSSNTLSISDQMGGSSYQKSEDGTTTYKYGSKTTTKDKGHEFNASVNATYTNKIEAGIGASNEFGATGSYGYTEKSKNNTSTGSVSASDKDTYSTGIKYENGFEATAGVSYGYHNNTNTVTKSGTDKVSTKSNIDENTSTWNSSTTASSTNTHSSSTSVRDTLSDIVTTTKGYGQSYSKGGTDTSTQGFSSTASNTSGTTSSVTYSKLESTTTTTTYSVDGKIEGKYRSILVGTAHVFAVVGYDYATKSFFTYTFSVMDDKVEEFLDYTPKGGDYTDCENSCLPFEIPYEVFEYVVDKTAKTTGVQYIPNSLTGTAKITGYVGSDTDVVIPSYVSDGQQAYKVTEIAPAAFAGKSVRSVVLGEFIKSIPERAFKDCTALEEVIGSFTVIGKAAFSGCTSLTNMNLPSNVVSIGEDAFAGANSIYVRAINSLSAYVEAVESLPEGTSDEVIEAKQKEITQKYIQSVLDCGARNIILDLSKIVDGVSLALEVPAIDSIEINGASKTYRAFSIHSRAKETAINEMTIADTQGIPLKIESDKLALRKVFVNGNTTALILQKDGAILSLIQDSVIQSAAKYAIIAKNPVIESQVTESGAIGYINVIGDVGYVNSIVGTDYAELTNGEFIKISEDEFGKYCKGEYAINYDANGGTFEDGSTVQTKAVFFGENYDLSLIPIRDYYAFDGWFTEQSGGVKLTDETVFAAETDTTVYAHWTPKIYTLSFNSNGGESVSPSSRQIAYGSTYGELPTPKRSYYHFDGWYTQAIDGELVTSGTMPGSDVTLYAHWTQNTLSDWVLASNVPEGASIQQKEYRYKVTTTSSDSSLPGWTWYETTSTQRLVSYHMICYATKNTSAKTEYRNFSVDGNYKAYGLLSSYGQYYHEWTYDASQVDSAPVIGVGGYSSYTLNGGYPGYNKGTADGYVLEYGNSYYVFFKDSANYATDYTYHFWKEERSANYPSVPVYGSVNQYVRYIAK